MTRILVVEDDLAIRTGLVEKLGREGYLVDQAEDGAVALRKLKRDPPELVVLDIMLPQVDGLTVLRDLRTRHATLPVLILSARGEEQQKVEGLRAGADDYLAKPFGLDELMARIEALLRRAYGSGHTITLGDLCIDTDSGTVTRSGEEIVLSPTELDLLLYLVRHRDRVLDRDEILGAVWGNRYGSNARWVDYHILKLRKKLEQDPSTPRHILTRHGQGYLLKS